MDQQTNGGIVLPGAQARVVDVGSMNREQKIAFLLQRLGKVEARLAETKAMAANAVEELFAFSHVVAGMLDVLEVRQGLAPGTLDLELSAAIEFRTAEAHRAVTAKLSPEALYSASRSVRVVSAFRRSDEAAQPGPTSPAAAPPAETTSSTPSQAT